MSDKLESLNNVCIQLGVQKVSRIQSGEMSEFQGLCSEMNERTVRSFGGVFYIVDVCY